MENSGLESFCSVRDRNEDTQFTLENIDYAIINNSVLKAFMLDMHTIYPDESSYKDWFVKLKLIEWIPLTYEDAAKVYNYMMDNFFFPQDPVNPLFTPETHQSQVPDHLLEEFAKYKKYHIGWVSIYRMARRTVKNAN